MCLPFRPRDKPELETCKTFKNELFNEAQVESGGPIKKADLVKLFPTTQLSSESGIGIPNLVS